MGRHVTLHEAKTGLSALVKAAEAGEVIFITRHGRRVARLVGEAAPAIRQAGDWRHQPGRAGFALDVETLAPLTAEAAAAEGWPT